MLFDQEFYKQHDAVAMVFPLRPILAHVFLCYNEKVLLQNCPSEFEPVISRSYLDDTFMLETSHSKIPKLLKSSTTSDLFQKLKIKTPYFFLRLKEVETMTNSRLQFTSNWPLAEFLPFLNVSSLSHTNTTCCLPYYNKYPNFSQILNFFIRKLTN